METYWMVAGLIAIGGLVIAGLMILRDQLVSKRRREMIDQVTTNVVDNYFPVAKDMAIEGTVEIMDELISRIPDWMGQITSTIQEMNKIED